MVLENEREIGVVNDWCYVVGRSPGDGLFWALRKSHCMACRGKRCEVLAVSASEEEVEKRCRKRLERAKRGFGPLW